MRIGTRVKVTNEAGTEYGTIVSTPTSALLGGGVYGVKSENDGEIYAISLIFLKEAR